MFLLLFQEEAGRAKKRIVIATLFIVPGEMAENLVKQIFYSYFEKKK